MVPLDCHSLNQAAVPVASAEESWVIALAVRTEFVDAVDVALPNAVAFIVNSANSVPPPEATVASASAGCDAL